MSVEDIICKVDARIRTLRRLVVDSERQIADLSLKRAELAELGSSIERIAAEIEAAYDLTAPPEQEDRRQTSAEEPAEVAERQILRKKPLHANSGRRKPARLPAELTCGLFGLGKSIAQQDKSQPRKTKETARSITLRELAGAWPKWISSDQLDRTVMAELSTKAYASRKARCRLSEDKLIRQIKRGQWILTDKPQTDRAEAHLEKQS